MDMIFKIDTEEEFKNVVDNILTGFYDKNIIPSKINESTLTTAKEEIKDIIFNTHCNAEKVYYFLLSRSFNKEKSKIVSALIEKKSSKLLYSTLVEYNSIYGETMSEFDWVLKLVYGTSELKKLNYPLMQLVLTTISKGCQNQRIYDISKDMLKNMINVLENVDVQT